LAGFEEGVVSLAVNGRVGRRVVCVLDNSGTMLESFDMEGDGDGDTTMDDDEDVEVDGGV
jgi:anaphase-promoting complex subunit 4